MKDNFWDSQEGIFLRQETERLYATVFEVPYAELQARSLFPPRFDGDPGESEVTFKTIGYAGRAAILSSHSTDIPSVNAYALDVTYKVKTIATKYEITQDDLDKAARTGLSIDSTMAIGARRVALQEEELIAFYGNSDHGLAGLVEHPHTTMVSFLGDGTGSSYDWANKSADQVFRDLNLLANATRVDTNEQEIPDTLLLSPTAHRIVRTTPIGENKDKMILELFLKANPNITSVVSVPRLTRAASDGSDIAVAYRRDPTKLFLYIPKEYTQLPPQPKDLVYGVPCHSKTAGLVLIRPQSIAWAKTSVPSSDPALFNFGGRRNLLGSKKKKSDDTDETAAIKKKSN